MRFAYYCLITFLLILIAPLECCLLDALKEGNSDALVGEAYNGGPKAHITRGSHHVHQIPRTLTMSKNTHTYSPKNPHHRASSIPFRSSSGPNKILTIHGHIFPPSVYDSSPPNEYLSPSKEVPFPREAISSQTYALSPQYTSSSPLASPPSFEGPTINAPISSPASNPILSPEGAPTPAPVIDQPTRGSTNNSPPRGSGGAGSGGNNGSEGIGNGGRGGGNSGGSGNASNRGSESIPSVGPRGHHPGGHPGPNEPLLGGLPIHHPGGQGDSGGIGARGRPGDPGARSGNGGPGQRGGNGGLGGRGGIGGGPGRSGGHGGNGGPGGPGGSGGPGGNGGPGGPGGHGGPGGPGGDGDK